MADNSSKKSIFMDEENIYDESSCGSDNENSALENDHIYPHDYADYINKKIYESFLANRKRLHNLDSSIKRGTQLPNSLASDYTAFDPLYPLSDRPSSLSSNYTPLHPLYNFNYRPSSLASNYPEFDPLYPLSNRPSSLGFNYPVFDPFYPLSNLPFSLASDRIAFDPLLSIRDPILGMPRSDVSSSMNTPWYLNTKDTIHQNSMSMNQNESSMPVANEMDSFHVTGTGETPSVLKTISAQESNLFPAVKKILHLTNSTLHPPNPNAPRPTTKSKPLGCKTVFVGGLPEKVNEQIIKEIFENCGTILTIRMSKKNFCHVRFSNEADVENAICFSGCRLMIENKDKTTYSGRLHVDYAQTRDDLYDYKNNQQDLEHQAHHKEQNNCRPITPPAVLYTDHEVSLICNKLKNEDTFSEAASILISWCEGGNCTKENADTFFSMIQSIHDHAKNLRVSKVKYEDQINESKKRLKKIVRQLTEIEKIDRAASLQKCWDHFTEDQKNNIEVLKRQREELKNAFVEKVINECEDREMQLHDDENDITNELTIEQLKQEIHRLREEGDTLKCQLEAAQNEIMAMQSDHTEKIKQKDHILLKTYLDNCQMLSKNKAELRELQAYKYRIESCKNEENLQVMKMMLKQKDGDSAAVQKALQDLNAELLKMRLKCSKYEGELEELHACNSREQSDLPF